MSLLSDCTCIMASVATSSTYGWLVWWAVGMGLYCPAGCMSENLLYLNPSPGLSLRFVVWEVCCLYIFNIKIVSNGIGPVLPHYIWQKTVFIRQKLVFVKKFLSPLTLIWYYIDCLVSVFTSEASVASSCQTHFATECVYWDKCSSQCSAKFSGVDAAVHISGKTLVPSDIFYSSETE